MLGREGNADFIRQALRAGAMQENSLSIFSAGLADIRFDHHGSVVLAVPLTPAGREWLETNVSAQSWQWFGVGLAIEPRYAGALLEGALDDGLGVV